MINKKLLVGLVSSVVLVAGCQKEAEEPKAVELKTLEQKVNYTIARNLANNFKQNG
jgi:outer membrane murein-binding lipoprotein Lpp